MLNYNINLLMFGEAHSFIWLAQNSLISLKEYLLVISYISIHTCASL